MNRTLWMHWAPVAVLAVGAVAASDLNPQRSMALEAPLASTIASEIAGYRGAEVEIPVGEREVAGFSSYLMRTYQKTEAASTAAPWFSLYVGYYESQTQGKTIHSPKNCLPGSGWEALTNRSATVDAPRGPVTVNRYVLQREDERALVLYWYQGRGRVQADEYAVKLDLLRDAALKRRSDEALVRIVVPIVDSEEKAFEVARSAASSVIPQLDRALPE